MLSPTIPLMTGQAAMPQTGGIDQKLLMALMSSAAPMMGGQGQQLGAPSVLNPGQNATDPRLMQLIMSMLHPQQAARAPTLSDIMRPK